MTWNSILKMLVFGLDNGEYYIFPLLTLGRKKSVYVEPVIQMLQINGFKVGVQKVDYELQRVGNEMLWAKHL